MVVLGIAFQLSACDVDPVETRDFAEPGGKADEDSEHRQLRVMTYNIMQLPVQDWDQAERASRLPAAIRALPALPDVIAFQEVFTDGAYAAILSMQDIYPYVTPVVGLDCSGQGWTSTRGNCSNNPLVIRGGVVIASRLPIAAQHQLIFVNSVSGSWDYNANKGAAYVRIETDGGDYHIVGTHLQSDVYEHETYQGTRLAQLGEIDALIDSMDIPETDPVILAGDLNVPRSDAQAIDQMVQAAHGSVALFADQDFNSYSSESPQSNWMARASNYYFGRSLCYDDTLDYILTRSDHLAPSEPVTMTVVPLKAATSWYWWYLRGSWSLCGGGYTHDGYTRDISDHYPVVATFRYAD